MDPNKVSLFVYKNQGVFERYCSNALQPAMSFDWEKDVTKDLDHALMLKRLRVITFKSALANIIHCIDKLERAPLKIAWTRNISNIENILALLTMDLLKAKGVAFSGTGTPLMTVDLLDLYEHEILRHHEKGVVLAAYATAASIARVEAHGFKVIAQERLENVHQSRLPPWMEGLKLSFGHSAIFDYRPLNQSCAFGIYAVMQPSDAEPGYSVINRHLFAKGDTLRESIQRTLDSERFSLQRILAENLIDPTTQMNAGNASPFALFSKTQ